MERIIITGSPGSGKSTLAGLMAERLSLPLIHLDALFWRPGWVSVSREEFDRLLAEAMAGERWIIDGDYGRTLAVRLQRADTAVFFDYPTYLCLFRTLKRIITNLGAVRPDMGEGCPERLDLEFLRYVCGYRRKQRGKVLEKLRSAESVNVIVIKNRREYNAFVRSLCGET